jgi:hypothetical protein
MTIPLNATPGRCREPFPPVVGLLPHDCGSTVPKN